MLTLSWLLLHVDGKLTVATMRKVLLEELPAQSCAFLIDKHKPIPPKALAPPTVDLQDQRCPQG